MPEATVISTTGRRMLVRSLELEGGDTVLHGGSAAGGPQQRRLPSRPDLASARRWLSTLRRIDRVEIDGTGPTLRCVAHAVGHRRPTTRPVALATALGLGALGVPLLIDLEQG